jgi:hypothetical protein
MGKMPKLGRSNISQKIKESFCLENQGIPPDDILEN